VVCSRVDFAIRLLVAYRAWAHHRRITQLIPREGVMARTIYQLVVLLLVLLLALPVLAAKEDKKGHGAGGMRDEHASEQGLEQGQAWSGRKEKKAKEAVGETEAEDAGKPGKESREKREKKRK
jgi:hypothetical protein